MNKPVISFTVVINGPVARAGSILRRSNAKGTKVPKTDAKTTTMTRAELTEMVKAIES